MAVSYKKLWKLLIDKDMKKKDLRIATGITTTALAKLGKNEHVLNHSQQAIIGTITKGGMLDNILKHSDTQYKILV